MEVREVKMVTHRNSIPAARVRHPFGVTYSKKTQLSRYALLKNAESSMSNDMTTVLRK